MPGNSGSKLDQVTRIETRAGNDSVVFTTDQEIALQHGPEYCAAEQPSDAVDVGRLVPLMLPLLIGAPVVVATVLIQGLGSMALVRLLFRYLVQPTGDLLPARALTAVILTALVLLCLHCVQIYVWALAYWWLPSVTAIETMEQAIYFSAVTFTTVGYGDITLTADQGRLLAGVEALNGVLLLGWSTALLFAVVQRTWGAFMQRKPWFKPLAADQAPARHGRDGPPHSG